MRDERTSTISRCQPPYLVWVQGVVHGSGRPCPAAAVLLRQRVQLPLEVPNLLLVPPNQAGLVHNLVAACCHLDLLGARGKLEGVVRLLCLAGGGRDGAHNGNARPVARQGALQQATSMRISTTTQHNWALCPA